MEEIWKDVDGYEGKYQISKLGNVMSLNYAGRGYARKLTPKCNNSGRLWVELLDGGKRKCMLIHRLVALAFIPNPENLPQINHKDENPKNNAVENLEWCDQKYNIRYSLERHPERYKEKRQTAKYGRRLNLKVDQFDKDGNFIKRWPNSRTIHVETKMSDWGISECCRGNRKTAHGFIWRYAS